MPSWAFGALYERHIELVSHTEVHRRNANECIGHAHQKQAALHTQL
jgi:hypothetical protein